MINKYEIADLLRKYQDNTISHDEYIKLTKIIGNRKYERDILFLMDENFSSEEKDSILRMSNVDANTRFSRLKQEIINQRKTKRRRVLMLAATLVGIVLASGFYFQLTENHAEHSENSWVIKSTGFGQKSIVTLPDGTVVYLNSGSEIKYPKNFSDTLRTVTLIGEAYFKVFRDEKKPFIVHTKNLSTRVLGTSFDVNSYDTDKISVSVVSGKVQVSDTSKLHSDRSRFVLLSNEQVVYNDSAMYKKKVNARDLILWKDNVLVFDDTPLPEAIAIINRWYDAEVRVKDKELESYVITGKFKENEKLKAVLEGLAFSLNVDYTITPENQIIQIHKKSDPDIR